ncbi:HEPN domain-containing protein [Rhodoferax sp. TS-BS-61-7]|uniref:HEPN domain-containing protein n=1 Tax=Rhodoferax sp. TS-BS-61-7 TaxID=2094194 RepID=UPI000CF6AF4D|nr:HEPN domain-containing protein [Rhodoferax sp. TS-BS-61-7]PQA77203.1 hypothetical protein C5F53_13305 [Rhodoferax sp. TS-BS-61-7]
MSEGGDLYFPNLEMTTSDHRLTFSMHAHLTYSKVIGETDFGKQVLQKLERDPRIAEFQGKLLSKGSSAGAVQTQHFAMWLAWCTSKIGEENAWKILDKWLEAEQIEVLSSLWVLGLEADSSIRLSGGLSIQKVEDMPDSNEKEKYLTVGRDSFGIGAASLPKCAITKAIKIPKFWATTPQKEIEAQKYWNQSQSLYDLASLLNTIPNLFCVPHFHTNYTVGLEPIGPFGGSGGGAPLFDVGTSTVSKISSDHSELVDLLLSKFVSKDDSEKDRLRLILSRLSQAKRRIQIEDKILDLGIALEMLLLNDNEKDQLALQFRLRGSWLVGETALERIEIYDLLKEIYEARSSVAHTGSLHRKNYRKAEKTKANIPRYENLAESALQQIILGGVPEWRDLVLGVKVS